MAAMGWQNIFVGAKIEENKEDDLNAQTLTHIILKLSHVKIVPQSAANNM